MRSSTTVEVALRDDGASVVRVLRCEAPLLVRQDTGDGALTLWLVGGAAGPLGGDDLSMRLVVGPGSSVRVRSVAAMLAQPGVSGGSSELRTEVEVGEDATLDWDPEPIISVRGSDHRSTTSLIATPTSTVRFADAASLGRHDEASGRLSLRQRVEVGGRPVLDHEVVLGEPGPLHGPGAHGPLRLVRSVVTLGLGAATSAGADVTADSLDATYPLAERASLTLSTRTRVRVGEAGGVRGGG